ncbi:MAG: hypothetical protein IPI17_07200 [Nitrosomonas sp.]|jgi:hypothetical protein|nr:hypothetical protein [Nitrosomonas sp.]
MDKIDPIRDSYYKPLEQAESWLGRIFYTTGSLSIVVFLIEKDQYPEIYVFVQIFFLLCAVTGFVLGLAIRLYWNPRAQNKRLEDFLSHALSISLSHERTVGYYNNEETDWVRKTGVQLLENSYFSKEIIAVMCKEERIRFFSYAALFFLIIIYRDTPIDLIIAISQVLFTEQLISRYFRVEWLRIKYENTYDTLYKIFQARPESNILKAMIISNLVIYENSKANGVITLSSEIFNRENQIISKRWERIKDDLVL